MTSRIYNVHPETERQRARHPMTVPFAPGGVITLPKSGILLAKGVVAPAYDQLQQGSCTGNASCGAAKTKRAAQGLPSWEPSRDYMYGRERLVDGDFNTDGGASAGDWAVVGATNGFCSEALDPYVSGEFLLPTPEMDADAALHKIAPGGYAALSMSIEAMLEELAAGNPVCFAFHVPPNFEDAWPFVTTNGIMPTPTAGTSPGDHEVYAVDYTLTAEGEGYTSVIGELFNEVMDFLTGKKPGEGFDGRLRIVNSWGTAGPLGGQFEMMFADYLRLAYNPISLRQMAG